MNSMICYRQRLTGEWVAVGIDGNSRMLELIYSYDIEDDFFFVFHAQLPPSRKTLKELGLER